MHAIRIIFSSILTILTLTILPSSSSRCVKIGQCLTALQAKVSSCWQQCKKCKPCCRRSASIAPAPLSSVPPAISSNLDALAIIPSSSSSTQPVIQSSLSSSSSLATTPTPILPYGGYYVANDMEYSRPSYYCDAAILTPFITPLLPFTRDGANPGIAPLIAQYAHTNQINIESRVRTIINEFLDHPYFDKRTDHLSLKHFPIANLEYKEERFIFVRLFNTQHRIESEKCCYLRYYLSLDNKNVLNDPVCQTLGIPVDSPTGFIHAGDITPKIPLQRPELTIKLNDGSLMHIWVADHSAKGGSTIELYVEKRLGKA